MNEKLPALVISQAIAFAIMTVTLMQRSQPLIVAPAVCPPAYAEPTPDKAPEPQPTTKVEDTPDALNFELPE
ncbi:MAG: hypothetical protein AAFW75_32390 [Cyanobacteria bacterium J06636_16]